MRKKPSGHFYNTKKGGRNEGQQQEKEGRGYYFKDEGWTYRVEQYLVTVS